MNIHIFKTKYINKLLFYINTNNELLTCLNKGSFLIMC